MCARHLVGLLRAARRLDVCLIWQVVEFRAYIDGLADVVVNMPAIIERGNGLLQRVVVLLDLGQLVSTDDPDDPV